MLTTTLGTVGALVLELTSFQSFLFLLGSCFVPLFAVLLADWLAAGRRYEPDDVFVGRPLRLGPIAAWVAGFAAYQWLSPTGPAWWVDQVQRSTRPRGRSVRRSRASRSRSCSRSRSRSRREARAYRPGRAREQDRARRQPAVDRVAGGEPRPGGGVFHAARAAARSARTRRVTRCAPADRDIVARAARGARVARHLAADARDDGVQLPLRGRPPRDGGRRRRRPVDARRRRGLGRARRSPRPPGCSSPASSARTFPRRRSRRSRATDAGTCCSTRRAASGRARRPARARRRRRPGRARAPHGAEAERGRGADPRGGLEPRACCALGVARGRPHARLPGRPGRRRASSTRRRAPSGTARPDRRGRRVLGRLPRRTGARVSTPSRGGARLPAKWPRCSADADERARRVRARDGRGRPRRRGGPRRRDEPLDAAPPARRRPAARSSRRRRTARRSSPSSTDGRRSSSRTTAASTWREAGAGLGAGRRGRDLAGASRPRASPRRPSGCTCRATAAASGTRSRSSCPGSPPSRSA